MAIILQYFFLKIKEVYFFFILYISICFYFFILNFADQSNMYIYFLKAKQHVFFKYKTIVICFRYFKNVIYVYIFFINLRSTTSHSWKKWSIIISIFETVRISTFFLLTHTYIYHSPLIKTYKINTLEIDHVWSTINQLFLEYKSCLFITVTSN